MARHFWQHLCKVCNRGSAPFFSGLAALWSANDESGRSERSYLQIHRPIIDSFTLRSCPCTTSLHLGFGSYQQQVGFLLAYTSPICLMPIKHAFDILKSCVQGTCPQDMQAILSCVELTYRALLFQQPNVFLSTYLCCRGILLRESSVLDALTRCSTIAVDKTGTLTTGTLSCIGMIDPLDAHRETLEESECF